MDYPVNDYRYYFHYLQHSAKGTTWHKENPKYASIKNGRYIYEENPTDEKIEEFKEYSRKKKNAKKVLKRMRKIDNERLLKAILTQKIMETVGTDTGKKTAEDSRNRASSALNATSKKKNKKEHKLLGGNYQWRL